MRRLGGWSLVELLVVVAIVALLVALLFPVFLSVRDSGRTTVCLSNTRQVLKASLLYMQDYDECFPLGFYRVGGSRGVCLRSAWGLLAPYMRDGRVLLCPSDAAPMDLTALGVLRGVGVPLCEGEFERSSFMPNWCLLVNAATYPDVSAVSLSVIPYPSLTGFWYEGWLGVGVAVVGFEPFSGVEPRHSGLVRVPDRVVGDEASRYRGRLQVGYVDGHVRGTWAVLLPDAVRRGDWVEVYARPMTVDGRLKPRFAVQGGAYHGRQSFFGWPVRPLEGEPGRFVFRCYPRPFACEEWH